MKYRKKTTTLILVLAFTVFAIVALLSHSSRAKDYKTVYLPVPVGVDLERNIESSMLIKVDAKSYNNISFKEFTTKYKEPDELRLKELILALKEKDVKKTSKMIKNAINKKQEDIQGWTNLIGNLFSKEASGQNLEELRIIEQFKFDDNVVFIWSINSPSNSKHTRYFSSFRFQKNDSGDFLWNLDVVHPLNSLLTNIIQQQAESAGSYIPKEPAKLKYEIPIVESDKNHQAYLCFNGITCDVNAYSDNTNSTNEIINFYHESYHTLRNQGVAEFAKFYTEESGKKFKEYYSNTDEDYIKYALGELINNERTIVFVLDGDPVYIVFYCNPKYKNTEDISKHIKYEYIIREKGTLKLTNYAYSDSFDQLLGNGEQLQNSFLISFIKDLIEKDK